jgi:hypothetical protein
LRRSCDGSDSGAYAEISQHAMPGTDVVLTEIESLKTRVQMAETAANVALENAKRAMSNPGYYTSRLAPFLGDASATGNTPPAGPLTLSSVIASARNDTDGLLEHRH